MRSRSLFGVAIAVWLLALAGPTHARVEDLDVVPEFSRVAIQASSGIYFDRPPQDGGTVFIPFAAQSGAGIGGPTNGLRAALEGRLRLDFRPDDPTPTLAIRGFSTLFAPVASGAWLPGVPGSATTPAAAQAAVAIGSPSAFATGRAALRNLALTIDASHPLVPSGLDVWLWPDGPLAGPTPDVVALRVADGVVDFGVSISALSRQSLDEDANPLVLSATRRIRVTESGDDLELRMPLDVQIEQSLVEPVSQLPVRVRLDLDGVLVARNFIPEPSGAAAAAAALGALALLSRRRRGGRDGRTLLQVGLLALLVGTACEVPDLPACTHDSQCPEPQQCVDEICAQDGSCANPSDCPDDQICDDGLCSDPEAPGGSCAGDGDCESESCTDGFCDGCEGDEDCDEVADDDCPDTPADVVVNEDGCFETRTQPDGTKVFLNTQNSGIAATADGLGPCIDCGYETPDGVVWDGFGETLFTSFGTFLHSTNGGVITAGTFVLDCSGDASCNERADGSYTCSGDAGECDATWPETAIDCGDADCEQLIDADAVDEPFAEVVIVSKEAIDANGDPTDGNFEFTLASDAPTPFQASIATSNGAGTKRLEYARHGDDLVVTENLPDGWAIDGVICSGAFTRDGSTITVTGFDESGHATCTFRNRRTSSGATIPAGGVTGPDVITKSHTFGLPPGNRIVVAGANGLVVMDPLTGEIPSVGNATLSFVGDANYRNLLGALIIETPAGDGSDAVFAYQNTTGASAQRYIPEIEDFGATQIFFGAYRDAVHLGSDPSQAEAVLTSGGVQFFEWTNFGIPGGELFPNTRSALGNFTGVGTPISAFAFPAKTRVLAVTTGTPGKLVIGNPAQPFVVVTVVGEVGDDPRRIRCLGSVCAVSNFGSDSLTLASWDGATNVAITDTQAVGDGPIGIDLRALDGGNVAIASTGFNDSTYAITVVSPAGAVVASASLPAPDGCLQPGHALWLGDAEQHLVLSCFDSDTLAVFVPAIPTP